MADDILSGPWNILKGIMGIPPPLLPAVNSGQGAQDDYSNPLPSSQNVTGGKLLAIPVASSRITGVAPDSQPPDAQAQALAQNPAVSSALDKAWAASNPDSPGYANKHEQGGWIRQNSKGDVWTEPWPQGNYNSIDPGSSTGHPYLGWILGGLLDQITGNKTIGEFHTHPSPSGDEGPSPADIEAVQKNHLPGIIQGPYGIYPYSLPSPAPPKKGSWLGS